MHCVLTIQYRVKFLIAAFVPDRSTLRYSFLNVNNLLSFFVYGANFKYNNEEISSVLIRWHDTLTFNIVLVSSRYLSCLVYNSNILSRREIILTNLLCSQTCSLRSFSRTLSLTYLNLALVWILPTVDAESAAFFYYHQYDVRILKRKKRWLKTALIFLIFIHVLQTSDTFHTISNTFTHWSLEKFYKFQRLYLSLSLVL